MIMMINVCDMDLVSALFLIDDDDDYGFCDMDLVRWCALIWVDFVGYVLFQITQKCLQKDIRGHCSPPKAPPTPFVYSLKIKDPTVYDGQLISSSYFKSNGLAVKASS